MNLLHRFPEIWLGGVSGGPQTVVLTPTARLASEVRRGHGTSQRARGLTTWRALNGATPSQWLDHLCSAALLRGEIPADAVPGTFLTWPQERLLWQKAVADDITLTSGSASELFDHEGLAMAALEADALAQVWGVEVPAVWQNDEFRAFARWRSRVREISEKHGWVGAQEALRWRIECLARGVSGLPERVGLTGFVTPDPVVERLITVLEKRGVEVVRVRLGKVESGNVASTMCIDARHECHAAAAWARERLAQSPTARLRIGVADWPARRYALESSLDAALHPDAIGAGWVDSERQWMAIGGEPLVDQWLVDMGLRLLQLAIHPRRVSFVELGSLLCGNGWSADVSEADVRAQIEAALREWLPPETSLERVVRRLTSADFDKYGAPRTLASLAFLAQASRGQASRQLPGEWGVRFLEILDGVGWPGERTLNVTETSACQNFRESLSALVTIDGVAGRVDAGSALRLLRQTVSDLTLTRSRQRLPAVEIGSLDEVLGQSVDGLWLMGMNEGAWPPPPRANPLLPAQIQRSRGVPGATSCDVSESAQRRQLMWTQQAHEVLFSWAAREGERALRISPLLIDLPTAEPPPVSRATGVAVPLERFDDSRAPAIDDAERARLRGGTALLAAQAVCPAWGFYQYRLGAAVLPAPTSGIDARIRGGLLHLALESFWRDRGLSDLLAMDTSGRDSAISQAVDGALARQHERDPDRISPRLMALERQRLLMLLDTWMDIEAQRADFTVLECEARHSLEIAGLPVRVVVDRVDQLADGRLVVVDYKSGRSASAESWADSRIVEPQLPIYAAMAFPDSDVAAVVLARVVSDDAAFLGVADTAGLIPGVKTLEDQRKRYSVDEFPDWSNLRRLWAERIEGLAREIMSGDAGVRVIDVASLAYCPVKPLLRLAERQQQLDERERT